MRRLLESFSSSSHSGSTSGTDSDSAFQIHTSCDRFQMPGIDAAANPAEMIQIHADGNRTNKSFVSDSVSHPLSPSVWKADHYSAVSIVLSHNAKPNPAPAFRDYLDRAFNSRSHWYSRFSHLICSPRSDRLGLRGVAAPLRPVIHVTSEVAA